MPKRAGQPRTAARTPTAHRTHSRARQQSPNTPPRCGSRWPVGNLLVDLPGRYANLTGQLEHLEVLNAALRPPDGCGNAPTYPTAWPGAVDTGSYGVTGRGLELAQCEPSRHHRRSLGLPRVALSAALFIPGTGRALDGRLEAVEPTPQPEAEAFVVERARPAVQGLLQRGRDGERGRDLLGHAARRRLLSVDGLQVHGGGATHVGVERADHVELEVLRHVRRWSWGRAC